MPEAVAYERRPERYVGRSVVRYPSPMGDGPADGTWGAYLKRITARPGWSVAELSRQSGVHRATIFGWMQDGSGEKVTIESILAIARGAGEPPMEVLRAAAGLTADDPEDEEIAMVLSSNLRDEGKAEIVESILRRRDRDRQHRMQDTVQMIRLAEGAERKAG